TERSLNRVAAATVGLLFRRCSGRRRQVRSRAVPAPRRHWVGTTLEGRWRVRAAAVLLLGMFVALAVAVALHPRPGTVERSVDEALSSGRSSPRFGTARDVSAGGSAGVVVVLAAVGASAAWFRWH